MGVRDLFKQKITDKRSPCFASIDIGTNTVLLLIVRRQNDGTLTELVQEQRFPRLGENLHATGLIQEKNMKNALNHLQEYVQLCKHYNVKWIKAVGTAALREAKNGNSFLNLIKQTLGLDIQLITGEEEARLAFLGSLSNKEVGSGKVLVVDIGGGSTEFIWGEKRRFEDCISVPIGSVKLTEEFGLHNVINETDEQRTIQKFDSFLAGNQNRLPPDIFSIVGTAGTFTTLAAIHLQMKHYDPRKIDGLAISVNHIKQIVEKLKGMGAESRLAIPGITRGRNDIILGGAIIAQQILRFWNKDRVLISDRGLRYGVIMNELRS